MSDYAVCTACGRRFYDDGNTLCAKCDARYVSFMRGVLPEAAARVLKMREESQRKLRDKFAAPPKRS